MHCKILELTVSARCFTHKYIKGIHTIEVPGHHKIGCNNAGCSNLIITKCYTKCIDTDTEYALSQSEKKLHRVRHHFCISTTTTAALWYLKCHLIFPLQYLGLARFTYLQQIMNIHYRTYKSTISLK